jgi:hypothetical protein
MPDSDRTFVLRVRITLYSNRTQNDTFNVPILRGKGAFLLLLYGSIQRQKMVGMVTDSGVGEGFKLSRNTPQH